MEKHSRLLWIDGLRGVLLLAMAINHIPNNLDVVLNHPLGYSSAAEGFVFLAGLMAGFVFARKLIQHGNQALISTARQRARLIYGHHLGAILVVFAGLLPASLVLPAPPPTVPPELVREPLGTLAAAALLLYQPPLLDVLPMYCLFVLVAPWIVRACAQGREAQVLLVSGTIWGLTNLLVRQEPVRLGTIDLGAFNVGAWQILFVIGVVLGHRWAAGRPVATRPRASLATLALLICGACWALRHGYVGLSSDMAAWVSAWTNKNNLPPLRLLNLAALFYLLALLLRRFPQLTSARPLVFLGQHSLMVFAAHVIAATALQSFPPLFAETASGRWVGTGVMVGVVYAAAAIADQNRRRNAERTDRVADQRNRQSKAPSPGARRETGSHLRPIAQA